MPANLNININGPSGGALGGSGGGGGLNPSTLARVVGLLEKQSEELEKQTRLLSRQGKTASTTYQQLNVTIEQTANTFTKITNESQKAAKAATTSANKAAAAWKRSGRAIRRSISGAFSGITSGRAFRTSGRGGLSPGGILAGLGDVSAIGVRVAGDVVGGLTKGLAAGSAAVAGGLASLLSGLPKVGGALAKGVAIAGDLVSGIISGIGGAVSSIADALGDVLSQAAGIAGKVLNVALAASIGVALTSAFRAAKLVDVRNAFASISETIGGSADSIQRFRKASNDTIPDLDLYIAANSAISLGAVRTEAEFEKLIVAGRRLGKSLGRTAKEGVTDLALGIGRASKPILDNLSLIVSVGEANKIYAEQIGKTVKQLTDQEKKLGFQALAFAKIDEKLAALGPEVKTFSTVWAQLTTAIQNTRDAIGESLLPVFEAITEPLRRIAKQIQKAFSENQAAIIEAITSALSGFLSTLNEVARILESEGFGGVFDRMKVAAVSLWETFKIAAEASIDFVSTKLDELWERTKAALSDAITDGFRGAIDILVSSSPVGELAKLLGFDLNISENIGGLPGNVAADGNRAKADALATKASIDFAVALERASKAVAPATTAFSGGAQGQQGGRQFLHPGGVFRSFPPAPQALVGGAGGPPTATVPLTPNPAQGLTAQRNSLGGVNVDLVALEETLGSVIEGIANLSSAAQEEIRDKLEKVASSGEKTARFIRKVEQARETLRIEELEAATRASKTIADEYERTAATIVSELESTTEQFAEQIARVQEALAAEVASIEERKNRAFEEIDSRAASAAESIRGGANRGNAPLNVRKAIEKVQRQQDRAQKDLLRNLSAGLSSQDLAANNGELLNRVLQQAGEIQTGAEALRIDAIVEANGQIADATEKSLDIQDELIQSQEEATEFLLDYLSETSKAFGEAKLLFEKQKAQLDAAKKERQELRRALSLLS